LFLAYFWQFSVLPDWKDIRYLRAGSPAQQAAYAALQQHAVLAALQGYAPILAGTFPLDIAVAGSDLDILCEVHDFDEFNQFVGQHFSQCPAYTVQRLQIGGVPSLVISFYLDEVEVELFGQALPAEQQAGYRHLVVEARLLALGGPALHQEIIRLKNSGLKTEPAFATLLALPGDPYQALLDLETCSDQQLLRLVQQRG
jgi:hypothetical protein